MALNWADLGGSIYANPELSKQAEQISAKQSRMLDLTTPGGPIALGKNHGDTVGTKIFGRITTSATSALSENQKVPMTTLPEYTVTATVYQRGIAVPFTQLRQDLDRLDVESPVINALRDHSSRTHNELIYNALVAGRSFCYVPLTASTGNFTTNGSPTGTKASNLNGFHLRELRRRLQQYNVPGADGKNFIMAMTPGEEASILGDSATSGFVDVKKYTSSADGLLNGEIGTYMGFRFTVDNDILPDNIGSGSVYGSAIAVGLDACREIIASPMQLLSNMNLGGDFNRQKAIAWLSVLTYKTVWNYTTHGEGRVCHVTSA